MEKKLLNEEMYQHIPCFKENLFILKTTNDSSLTNKTKPGVNSTCQQTKGSSEVNWFQYVMYLHIIILYFLLFSLYNELKRTKETMNEFHMNMIDITIKGLEVEKNCISEINNFKRTLNYNCNRRMKREIPTSSEDIEKSYVPSPRSEILKFHSSNFSESEIPQERKPRKIPNDRRGKKKNKRKNRRRRGHGTPKASHFIGAFPEPHIKDGGILAPWLLDKDAIKDFSLVTKVPSRGREAVEIVDSGLYFIYAQVYYITPKPEIRAHNSFSIMLKPLSGIEVMLAQCATLGDTTVGGDASCFTATAFSLSAGDLVYIKQRERDRNIIMKRGQTFLGLILLNKK